MTDVSLGIAGEMNGVDAMFTKSGGELALIMRWAFAHMQAEDGGAVYLRLTTRAIAQIPRTDSDWEQAALAGAYWLKPPATGSEARNAGNHACFCA